MNRTAISLAATAALACYSASAFAKPADGFPDKFLGRWGGDAAGCAPGAIHDGLSISRTSVADAELKGTVQSVTAKADGSIDVTEIWEVSKGEPSTFVTNYRLTDGGDTLTVKDVKPADADVDTFIRCKALHD